MVLYVIGRSSEIKNYEMGDNADDDDRRGDAGDDNRDRVVGELSQQLADNWTKSAARAKQFQTA